jgi:pimeloyl-ACP methyl ester carboxylesterase
MTTFALVHGSWHGAWCWELLTPLLQQEGHDVVTMDLPRDNGSASFETYADVVCAALVGCDDNVALVGHSLAGSTVALVAARRPVRHLVYFVRLGPRQWPQRVRSVA